MQILALWWKRRRLLTNQKHSQSDILQISFFTLNLFLATKKRRREKSWGCLQMKTTEVDGNKLNGYERSSKKQPQCHGMEREHVRCARWARLSLHYANCHRTHIWFGILKVSFSRVLHVSHVIKFFLLFSSLVMCCMHFVFITFSSTPQPSDIIS